VLIKRITSYILVTSSQRSISLTFSQKKQGYTNTARRVTIWQLHICLRMVFSSWNKNPSFAEISRKFSAVRWFNKTEDCIFPCSFILRSNVQSFIISPSFNLAISPTLPILFLFIYPFWSTHPLHVSEISSELILYTTSPLYLFSPRLMQFNVCHTLHSWK